VSIATKPQLWVIAGPNGAGKSTLVQRYVAGRVPVVNPDDIAREIDPHHHGEPGTMLRAGRLALQQR
jgi:predicted ABC-type ATPase